LNFFSLEQKKKCLPQLQPDLGWLIAGFLNGSWNVSFSPTHGLAVRRISSTTAASDDDDNNNNNNNRSSHQQQQPESQPENNNDEKDSNNQESGIDEVEADLSYHHAWVLFQFYAALINVPICLWWVGGPERASFLVRESSALEIGLVVLFSVLWGIGSVGFGLACKIAGVGLGTNLTMGVIMVLGTFVPLCLKGSIATVAGATVIAGLVLCCLGLAFSVLSLQARDAVKSRKRNSTRLLLSQPSYLSLSFELSLHDDANTIATIQGESNEKDIETGIDEKPSSSSSPVSEKSDSLGSFNGRNEINSKSNGKIIQSSPPDAKEYSTVQKVLVCLIAGICSTSLQFAFVFGGGITDLAKDSARGPGSTPPSGTSAIIWLLAISLGASVSIVYGLYNNPSQIPLNRMWKCPWYHICC